MVAPKEYLLVATTVGHWGVEWAVHWEYPLDLLGGKLVGLRVGPWASLELMSDAMRAGL